MATIQSKYPNLSLPLDMSLFDFIFQNIDEYRDSVAVVDAASGRSYTFDQVDKFSRCIASSLVKSGLKAGEVVGILSPNLPEYILMFCGVARMGGVVSGVNPLYTEDELVFQMELVEACLLVSVPPFAEKCLNAQKRLPKIKDVYVFGEAEGCKPFKCLLADDGSSFPEMPIPLDHTLTLPFSSGTTGLPKGVVLTHRNIMWTLLMIESYPGLLNTKPGETILALLPYFHIYGLAAMLLHGLRKGARQVTMMRFEKESFLEHIQKYQINYLYLVPPIVLFLAKHPSVDHFDLSCVKEIISGAAPLGGDIAAAVKSRCGIKSVRQGYGMTETGCVTHLSPADNEQPSSVGLLMPNSEAKIIDVETGKVLGEGEDGELWVKGPQIMDGYFKNPEATAMTIDSDKFLHSGDIAHYDKDQMFFIVDRVKELIKYKGYQVPPAELEALLLTHPAIVDAAVIGIHDDEAGELPKAFVVKRPEELTEEDVQAFVAEKVAPYKKLRGGVEFVASIPKSASGKILRRILRDRAASSQ